MPSRDLLQQPDEFEESKQDIHPLADDWENINFLGKSQIIRDSKLKLIMSRKDLEMLIREGSKFSIIDIPNRPKKMSHTSFRSNGVLSRKDDDDFEIDDALIQYIADRHFATIKKVGREDIGD